MKNTGTLTLLILFLYCSNFLYSQSFDDQIAAPTNEEETVYKYDIFSAGNSNMDNEKTNTVVTKYVLYSIIENELQQLITEQKSRIELTITDALGKRYPLKLKKVNLFSHDFKINSSNPNSTLKATAIHYRGIVANNAKSMVAISFLENEVMGFISEGKGQLVIGKLKGENDHIIYHERDLKVNTSFSCGGAPNSGIPYSVEQLNYMPTATKNVNCVRLYIEVDGDVFADKRSMTVDYVTGLFNQSNLIFTNSDIPIILSEIFVHEDTTHSYTKNCAFLTLQAFQNATTSINGDIGHLVSYGHQSIGIAAGIDALCNSNVNEKLCYSGIESSFENVPIYSSTIHTFTHEIGHLLGSRHTHACVWNGDNTQIDNCAGCAEEQNPPAQTGCSGSINCNACWPPPPPPSSGTVMSYCDGETSVNFSDGFHIQTRAVIHFNIAGATCLTSCSGTSSSDCEKNLLLVGSETSTGYYEVSRSISSTQTIEPTANVTYSAGKWIELNTSFFAKSGSVFLGEIDGCAPSPKKGSVSSLHENQNEFLIGSESLINLTAIPNPFTKQTTISFQLFETINTNLSIYNIAGRKITELTNGNLQKGMHSLIWKAEHEPSGIYLARLVTENEIRTMRLVLGN